MFSNRFSRERNEEDSCMIPAVGQIDYTHSKIAGQKHKVWIFVPNLGS